MAEKFPLMTYVTGILARLNANSRKPTAYLYNGIRLPALPEWDRVKHPYYIVLVGLTNMLYISTSKFLRRAKYVDGALSDYTMCYFYAESDGEAVYYTYSPTSETEWTRHEYRDTDFVAGETAFSYSNADVCLANFDVKNYDDGTLYLAASEPVPVYD